MKRQTGYCYHPPPPPPHCTPLRVPVWLNSLRTVQRPWGNAVDTDFCQGPDKKNKMFKQKFCAWPFLIWQWVTNVSIGPSFSLYICVFPSNLEKIILLFSYAIIPIPSFNQGKLFIAAKLLTNKDKDRQVDNQIGKQIRQTNENTAIWSDDK